MRRTFENKADLLRYLNKKAEGYRQSQDPTEFDDLLANMGLYSKCRVTIKDTNETLDYKELWDLFDAEGSVTFPKN